MDKVSLDVKSQLEASGAAILEKPKGIPRIKYYTPDGRGEWKIPQKHIRGDGVVYDIFLAQGYTLTPPENPKPYCKGCDRWHDTQEEVDGCIKKKADFINAMTRKANEELAKERKDKDGEIADLKDRVDKLTKLLEDKLGTTI